jgi:hypothetical protein
MNEILDIDFDRSDIPHGDMPGDKVDIKAQHIEKAKVIIRKMMDTMAPALKAASARAVVSLYGGSGVGKSEIGSVLALYLGRMGLGAYLLSGDNYPHRIPADNDRERLLAFREYGLKGMVAAGDFTKERNAVLQRLQGLDRDADPALRREYAWLASYQAAGRRGLEGYLGTPREIDFEEMNRIIAGFKSGSDRLVLKRMGRSPSELWYDSVDMAGIKALIIEWTHGNSDFLLGVDFPIFLNSTPEETLEHRRTRNRDGAADSPFTSMVLAIEQELLASQIRKAKLIVARNGGIVGC